MGEVSAEAWEQRFAAMEAAAGTYFVLVVEDLAEERVVGAATLVAEKKFIHGCGQVTHVMVLMVLMVAVMVVVVVLMMVVLMVTVTVTMTVQVGRVEDVVVSDQHRGRQLGKLLVASCALLATRVGCYKVRTGWLELRDGATQCWLWSFVDENAVVNKVTAAVI